MERGLILHRGRAPAGVQVLYQFMDAEGIRLFRLRQQIGFCKLHRRLLSEVSAQLKRVRYRVVRAQKNCATEPVASVSKLRHVTPQPHTLAPNECGSRHPVVLKESEARRPTSNTV